MPGSVIFEDAAFIRRLIKAVDPEAPVPKQLIQLERQAKSELIHLAAKDQRRAVILAGYAAQEIMLAHGMQEKIVARHFITLMEILVKKMKIRGKEQASFFSQFRHSSIPRFFRIYLA